jgi:hypothetical protein
VVYQARESITFLTRPRTQQAEFVRTDSIYVLFLPGPRFLLYSKWALHSGNAGAPDDTVSQPVDVRPAGPRR